MNIYKLLLRSIQLDHATTGMPTALSINVGLITIELYSPINASQCQNYIERPAKLKGIDKILFSFRGHITVKISSFFTAITVKFANFLPKIAAFFKI